MHVLFAEGYADRGYMARYTDDPAGLEAHLQNSLPTFRGGRPHRIAFRDFAGLRLHLPRLAGGTGWLACAVERLVEGGDHVIVLGTVLAADRQPAPPLTYHARVFGTHTTLEVSRSCG